MHLFASLRSKQLAPERWQKYVQYAFEVPYLCGGMISNDCNCFSHCTTTAGTQWEGGIRVPTFISGGFLPAKVRGTSYNGLVTGWVRDLLVESGGQRLLAIAVSTDDDDCNFSHAIVSRTGIARSHTSQGSTPQTGEPRPHIFPRWTRIAWCQLF